MTSATSVTAREYPLQLDTVYVYVVEFSSILRPLNTDPLDPRELKATLILIDGEDRVVVHFTLKGIDISSLIVF